MQAVEKEKQKLSSVLASMSEGVIATDKDGEVTLINESAGKLIGRNPNKLIGIPLLDLLNIEDRIVDRSEERRVGKECRSWCAAHKINRKKYRDELYV